MPTSPVIRTDEIILAVSQKYPTGSCDTTKRAITNCLRELSLPEGDATLRLLVKSELQRLDAEHRAKLASEHNAKLAPYIADLLRADPELDLDDAREMAESDLAEEEEAASLKIAEEAEAEASLEDYHQRVAFMDAKQAEIVAALEHRNLKYESHGRDNFSRYISVLDAGGNHALSIRISDHPQPSVYGVRGGATTVGGYNMERGERHDATDYSIDSENESLDDLIAQLDDSQWRDQELGY